jgi:hypothetical protein
LRARRLQQKRPGTVLILPNDSRVAVQSYLDTPVVARPDSFGGQEDDGYDLRMTEHNG